MCPQSHFPRLTRVLGIKDRHGAPWHVEDKCKIENQEKSWNARNMKDREAGNEGDSNRRSFHNDC